ncbi:MAG: response regulator [Sphingomonadales bacterium]
MTKVLLVDDNDSILGLFTMILTREGYSVAVASNGVEALSLARRKKFDVVITDIIMPFKDGIETIMELKGLFPAIKIIAISGGERKGNKDLLRMAEMAGACRIVSKPFEPHDLVATLKDCLAT